MRTEPARSSAACGGTAPFHVASAVCFHVHVPKLIDASLAGDCNQGETLAELKELLSRVIKYYVGRVSIRNLNEGAVARPLSPHLVRWLQLEKLCMWNREMSRGP